MVVQKPSAHKEAHASEEIVQKNSTVSQLNEKAEKITKDPNKTAAQLIHELDGNNKPYEKNAEGKLVLRADVQALQAAVIDLAGKLHEKGVDLDLVRRQPNMLVTHVQNHLKGNILKLPELAARDRLKTIISQEGPTSAYIKEHWEEWIDASEKDPEDYLDIYKREFNDHPVATTALTIAAACGIYLIGSEIYSWFKGKDESKKGSFNAGTLAALGFFGGLIVGGGSKFYDFLKAKMIARAQERLEKAKQTMEETVAQGGGVTNEMKADLKAAVGAAKTTGALSESQEKELEDQVEGLLEDRSLMEDDLSSEAILVNENGEPLTEEEKIDETLKSLAEDSHRSKEIFLRVYFYERQFQPKIRRKMSRTIVDLKTVKLSEIKSIHSKYKSEKSIPLNAFSQPITTEIDERDLFALTQGLIDFAKFMDLNDKDDVEVWDLFEEAVHHPLVQELKSLHGGIIDAVKEGDFTSAIEGIASELSDDAIREKGGAMIDKINAILGINVDHLNEKQKELLTVLQVEMFVDVDVMQDPRKAMERILKAHPEYRDYPEVIEPAIAFMTTVQEKIPAIHEKVMQRFEIKPEKEDLDPNWLRHGVRLDEMSLFNASQLVLAEEWMEEGGHWAGDLMILSVLLRSFESTSAMKNYRAQLLRKIAEEPSEINIPGIKNLAVYFQKIGGKIGGFILEELADITGEARYFFGHRATDVHNSADDLKRMAREDFWFSLGGEAVLGSLDFTSDAIALISLSTGMSIEDLSSFETGREYLDYLRLMGGNIGRYKHRDGRMAIVVEFAGQFFVSRPKKIFEASIESLFEGTADGVLGAFQTVLVGSGSFMASSGLMGGFRTAKVKGGRTSLIIRDRLKNALVEAFVEGPKYIYKAPMMGVNAAKNTVQALATGGEMVQHYRGSPRRVIGRTVNWFKDARKYKALPGQNVVNLVNDARLLEYHLEMARNLGVDNNLAKLEMGILEKMEHVKDSVLELPGNIVRTARDLGLTPKETLRRLTAGAWHWRMAQKFAKRSYVQQADFLLSLEGGGRVLNDLGGGDMTDIAKRNRSIFNMLEWFDAHPEVRERIVSLSKEKKRMALVDEVKKILKEAGLGDSKVLDDFEVESFAKRLVSEKKVKQILGQMEAGLAHYRTLDDLGEVVDQAMDGVEEMTRTIPTDNLAARLSNAGVRAELSLERQIAHLNEEITALERYIQEVKRSRGALDLDEIRRLGELRDLKRTLESTRIPQGAEQIDEVAESLGSRVGGRARRVVEALSETSTRARSAMGSGARVAAEQLGNLAGKLKGIPFKKEVAFLFKWGGRFGATGLSAAGLLTAVPAGYEAFTTENEDHAAIQGTRAVLGVADAGIGIGATVSSFKVAEMGARTLAGRALGYASAALIPITVAAENVLDVKYDETKTESQWAQIDYHNLMHQWVSTYQGVSLGDAFITAGQAWNPYALLAGGPTMNQAIDESMKRKYMTMKKMFRVMIADQENPVAFRTAVNEGGEANIDQAIEDNYTDYHEYYLQKEAPQTIHDYQYAQKFLVRAQVFNEVMEMREAGLNAALEAWIEKQNLTNDQERAFADTKDFEAREDLIESWGISESFVRPTYVLAAGTDLELDLMDEKYDIESEGGVVSSPSNFLPSRIIAAYKAEKFSAFETAEESKVVRENLKEIETPYLLYLYTQINNQMAANNVELQAARMMIRDYLMLERHVNVDLEAASHEEYFKPELSFEALEKHIQELNDSKLESYKTFQASKVDNSETPKSKLAQLASVVGMNLEKREDQNAGVHSMYRLAEYFGYHGLKKESELKAFFSEESREFHSVYWDADEGAWYLYERGWERDDEMGPDLSKSTIDNIIYRMREQPDNVTKHRLDSVFHDAFDYSAQVMKMADILEKGYSEGVEKYGAMSSKFKKWELDYWKEMQTKEEKESNPLSYIDSAIAEIKKDGKWTQLDWKVINDNKIELKRLDTSRSVTLYRKKGSKEWWVEDYSRNANLAQAVVLGNLINATHKNFDEQGHVAGVDSMPFSVDGDTVDFDRNNNPIDLTIIEGSLPFYNEIGLSKQKVAKVLNQWYRWEYKEQLKDSNFDYQIPAEKPQQMAA